MSKKKIKLIDTPLKRNISYILTAILIVGLAFLGSLNKDKNTTSNLNIGAIANNNFNVSTDQLSEFYMVANTADAFNLASVNTVGSNYVVVSVMRKTGQGSSDASSIDKPVTVDTSDISRGVITYVVSAEDSMESIAAQLGITTDQIRWSNGLKTTDVSVGQTLYLPNVQGIVYTIKSGDTIEKIVKTYGSTAEQIIAANNLDPANLSEGAKIILPGGTLPNSLRPEYVAPRRTVTVATYSYTYLGSTSNRQNIQVLGKMYGLGGPYVAGQCTQWAWYKRQDLPSNLGNARTWATNASRAGFTVNRTPSAGAIFQTPNGTYGHVGYVEAVNEDGSIVVTEMNYQNIPYRVIRATIPASAVSSFYYIH